jgi:regulatory protein YycI of two-component signal transduction system YycFG
MEVITPIWQRAAEFGVLAFLLVLVLLATGFAAWKIGNRVADVLTDTLTRQAAATDRTADAVEKISTMTAVMATHAESWEEKLSAIHQQNHRQTKATKIMIEAMRDVIPVEKSRVLALLESARAQLEE